MEVIFKNTTRSTKKLYNQFLDFHEKQYKRKDFVKNILFLIAFAYVISFNIVHNDYKMVLIFCVLGAIYFAGNGYYSKKVVKKELRSEKIQQEKLIKYDFYEKTFKIELDKQSQELKYYQIYRVHQDEHNFYLYTDKTHTFIIDKNGFEKGNINDFKEFMRRKCKSRFKKQRK